MQSAGGLFNKVWMLPWYQTARNTVFVLMKEENNKFVVKQKVNGLLVAKKTFPFVIDPNVSYDVQISFDGTNFTLTVDGTNLGTLAAGGTPSGTIAFKVKNTTGTFGLACVD